MGIVIFTAVFFLVILGTMGGLVFWQLKKTDPKNNDSSLKSNIKTAQEFLPFEGISDSMINMGNHQYRALIEVSSINYELRTKKERDVLELSYQRFLNSLDFPYSIFIHSRTVDNTKMLNNLQKDIQETLETFPQLAEYGETHLGDMGNFQDRTNTHKQKKKYIVVPYDDIHELTNLDDDEKYSEAAKELFSRCSIVIDNLEGLGLKGRVLTTEEVASVITSTYHRDNHNHINGVIDGDYLERFVFGENKMADILSEGKLDLILIEAKSKLKSELINSSETPPYLLESVNQAVLEIEEIRDKLAGFYKSEVSRKTNESKGD